MANSVNSCPEVMRNPALHSESANIDLRRRLRGVAVEWAIFWCSHQINNHLGKTFNTDTQRQVEALEKELKRYNKVRGQLRRLGHRRTSCTRKDFSASELEGPLEFGLRTRDYVSPTPLHDQQNLDPNDLEASVPTTGSDCVGRSKSTRDSIDGTCSDSLRETESKCTPEDLAGDGKPHCFFLAFIYSLTE